MKKIMKVSLNYALREGASVSRVTINLVINYCLKRL